MLVALLTLLARLAIKIHKPTIIAITGSVGKTTTKDIILAELSATGVSVRGTIRSQNSDISTPLSVFGLELHNGERRVFVWLGIVCSVFAKLLTEALPDYLVLEVGAGHPGDIPAIAQWLRPQVVVYTALAKNPVHVEFFDSREALFQEKKQLALLSSTQAHVLYPADDDFLPQVLEDVPRSREAVDMEQIKEVRFDTKGTHAVVEQEQVLIPGVWSETMLRSYLMGKRVVAHLGLDGGSVRQKFAQHFVPSPGRTRILRGIRGAQVVDDSYNASPKAVSALLRVVERISVSGKKILVFGDMKELGEYTVSAHEEVGREAARVCDVLVLVGVDVRDTERSAIDAGMNPDSVLLFDNSNDAGEYLGDFVAEGDLVVAKSSRHSIKMEQCLQHVVVPEDHRYLSQEYLQG